MWTGVSRAAHLGEVVDPGKLEDGGQAVEEAADDEPVQGGGVVNLEYSTVQYSAVQYSTVQYSTDELVQGGRVVNLAQHGGRPE